MYVQFCHKMSQPDFTSAILVFYVLENVGHFVCVIIIGENMQVCVCVCVFLILREAPGHQH